MSSKIFMTARRILKKVQNHRTDRNKDPSFEFFSKFRNTLGNIQPTSQAQLECTSDQNETIWPKAYKGIIGTNERQQFKQKRSYGKEASNDKFKIIIEFVYKVVLSALPRIVERLLVYYLSSLIMGYPVATVIPVEKINDYISEYLGTIGWSTKVSYFKK